jgi:hypothetical protein
VSFRLVVREACEKRSYQVFAQISLARAFKRAGWKVIGVEEAGQVRADRSVVNAWSHS